MEQTGEEIDRIRRTLRERADADAARALDRERRRSAFWPGVRSGARVALAGGRRQVQLLATRVKPLGPVILKAARQLARVSVMLTRRSIVLAETAVGRYRASRDLRARHRKAAPTASTAPPTPPPTAADARVDRDRQSEQLERQQLALRETALGPNHPDVALVTYIIATRCATRGDYDEARALYERTWHIFERTFGPDHPEVAAVLSDLAELDRAAGRTDDATWFASRATEITLRRQARLLVAADAADASEATQEAPSAAL